MRKAILRFSLALITLLGATMLSVPAFATDARQAIALCDKRKSDCTMRTDTQTGNTTLCVNNSGKTECVQCPLQGNCVIYSKGGSKGKIGSVGGILTGGNKGPVGNTPPKRTQPVVGGLKPPISSGSQSDTMLRANNSQHSGGSNSHK